MFSLYTKRGIWYLRFKDPQTNKWGAVSTGKRSKREAQAIAPTLYQETLERKQQQSQSLIEACNSFYAMHERKKSAEATLQLYARTLDLLIDHFGELTDIESIGSAEIQGYVQWRQGKGVSNGPIGFEVRKLIGVLRYAQKQGKYHKDPSTLMPDELKGRRKKEINPLTDAEVESMIAALRSMESPYADHFIGYVYTGCRMNELMGIRKGDVDFQRGKLFINGTKTPNAKRFLPIAPALLPILKRRCAMKDATDRIFEGNTHSMRRHFHKACEEANTRQRVKVKDLRDTFATMLVNAGVSNRVVADMLGHANSLLVDEVYSHVTHETKQRAMERFPAIDAGGNRLELN